MAKSFWELLSGNEYDAIVVPVIQRDYAQGRTDERATTIRKNFLNSIGAALSNDSYDPLSLDFIYGAKAGKQIELIDGQQRFTTLFLLHWYLAGTVNAGDAAFDVLKKFTYRSRTSSKDFCEKLCKKANYLSAFESVADNANASFSGIIRDKIWFLKEWENDPTVLSLLNMLDAIKVHPEINADCRKAWEVLTGARSPIVFQFLSVDDFGNSEDLYIKMNSRGKPLSDFENFKALFGKHLDDSSYHFDKDLLKKYWRNIDGDWSKVFWDFICKRYQDKGILEPEYYYSIDNTIMKYIWLQVEMYSVAINTSRAEQPDYYTDGKPKLVFEHIDDSDHKYDWVNWPFPGKKPEELLVLSLERSKAILSLISELLDGSNGLTCWNSTSSIDRLFLLEKWDNDAKKPIRVSGTGTDDYMVRILAFVIIYWCCEHEIPVESWEKDNLKGYLRVIRNSLQRYRSKKAGKRVWDTELDKKNYGKAVSFILGNVLRFDKNCLEQMSDLTEQQRKENTYFSLESEKCALIKTLSENGKQTCFDLEDTEILQGTVMPFLSATGLTITPSEFSDLFNSHNRVQTAKALLACGEDDSFFAIPSGERNSNRNRIAFCDEASPAWSIALLYQQDGFSSNNTTEIKKLLSLSKTKPFERIISDFIEQCEELQEYSWRYYFIKYWDDLFATNKQIYIGDKYIDEWPTFDMDYSLDVSGCAPDRYACRTSTTLSRFSNTNTCNIFLIIAASEWCKQNGKCLSDTFVGGQPAKLTTESSRICLSYDSVKRVFVVSKDSQETIIQPKKCENVVTQLVDSINALA